MSVLSSFIGYRKRNKEKQLAQSPQLNPNQIRYEPFAPPHLYSSPVHIISDHSTPIPPAGQQYDAEKPDTDEEERAPALPAPRAPSPSPQLHLDIASEPLDWFGPALMKSGIYGALRTASSNGATDAGGRINNDSAEVLSNAKIHERSANGEAAPQAPSQRNNLERGAAESSMPTSSTPDNTAHDPDAHIGSGHKRSAPAPIRIPEHVAKSKIQVEQDSLNADLTRHYSRPDSLFSESDSSAISGTALARVVLGDSFALSAGRSHYRSGASMLVRADSATLPRETMYLLSPWRSEAAGDEFQTPIYGMQLSPMPPIPAAASQVYVPPTTPRANTGGKTADSRIPSPRVKGSRGMRNALDANQLHVNVSGITDSQAARSISRISVDASAPPTPVLAPSPQLKKSPLIGRSPSNPPALPLPDPPVQSSPSSSPSSVPSSSPVPLSPKGALPAAPNGKHPSTQEVPVGTAGGASSPTRLSVSSAPDIDGVLDYYSLLQTPEASAYGFKPAFSPITEESPSQMTPNTIWRPESQRSMLSILASAQIRGDAVSPPKPVLLPIREQPHLPQSPASSTSTVSDYSQASPSINLVVSADSPPLASQIFNRQRSGSAPNPIKVIRDPALYNIGASPVAGNSGGLKPPGYADRVNAEQTFPETPSAFSPIWSPKMPLPLIIPTAYRDARDVTSLVPTSPTEGGITPISAKNSFMRSSSQRILMNRAGASARARQGRSKSNAPRRMSKSLDLTEGRGELAPSNQDLERSPSSASKATTTISVLFVQGRYSLEFPSLENKPLSAESNDFPTDALPRDSLLSSDMRSYHESSSPISIHDQHDSPLSVASHLASMQRGHVSPAKSTQQSPVNSLTLSPARLPTRTQDDTTRSSSPRLQLRPSASASTVSLPSTSTFQSSSSRGANILTPYSTQPPLHLVVSAPSEGDQSSGSPLFTTSPLDARGRSPFTTRFSSPPSYEAVILDTGTPQTSFTASSAGLPMDQAAPRSGTSQQHGAPHLPSQQALSLQAPANFKNSASLSREASTQQRRALTRPAMPAGPRRPSQQSSHTPITEERNASVSSIPSIGQRVIGVQHASPKFQSPPVKWRGYTVEAAKWTFSNGQWKDIVSKAIKRANEANAIRLLKPDSVDHDIPEEKERLELQRVDVKTKYKLACRKRNAYLEKLAETLDGTEPEDSLVAKQVLSHLKEVTLEQDRLAEELHNLDEQIGQLQSLLDVHFGSSLAMALRKLYTSWDKQLYINQVLRDQVMALEAERDEAWKNAEEVAHDYDALSERFSSETTSHKRASKVMSRRKSSNRVTQAGLRQLSGTISHRLTMGGASHRMSNASGAPLSARTTYSSIDDNIPPVLPIPWYQMTDRADRSLRFSSASQAISMDSFTPTSATRAMVKAQEELYELLGISVHDTPAKGIRRSNSAMGLGGDSRQVAQNLMLPPKLGRRRSSVLSIPRNDRPSSLPRSLDLQEVYSSKIADRDAMLAAINMLAEP